MNKEAYVFENFYTRRECEFLMKYYKKYWKGYEWEESKYLRWKDAPFYHFRFNYLKWKYKRKVRKVLSFLKISHGQLVEWEPGAFKPHHIDIDHNEETQCSWTSVCYLNDNYGGGATMLENVPVQPIQGNLILFCSKEIPHGVEMVYNNSRYTSIVWWKV